MPASLGPALPEVTAAPAAPASAADKRDRKASRIKVRRETSLDEFGLGWQDEMGADTEWVAASYGCAITAQLAFGAYAIVYARKVRGEQGGTSREASALSRAEGFVTARGTQGRWRLGWSLFAGSMGAWAVTAPAAFAVHAGVVGMVTYALSCGIPIMFIVQFGPHIQAKWPQAGSLADFAELRFGARAKSVVLLISMLNMCVALLAELTTIGALFRSFVGGGALPMILVSSLIATFYTAYGGLLVSIVTDQLQALFSILLICCLTIYTATKLRDEAPDLGPLSHQLGPANPFGWSALFVMPVSLTASTVFSQSVWQRVYAAQTARALKEGGVLASVTIVVTVFLFGMAGFLAAWAGLINKEDDPNLYLFQLLKDKPDEKAQVNSWSAVAVLVLASTMSEGAIDSLQNGMIAVLQALVPRNESIMLLRVFVVVLSGCLVVLALDDLPVLEIFLVANMLCRYQSEKCWRKAARSTDTWSRCGSCSFLPFLFGGLLADSRYINEPSLLFSIAGSMGAVSVRGVAAELGRVPGRPLLSDVSAGIHLAWMGNGYKWDYFATAAGTNLVLLAVCSSTPWPFWATGRGVARAGARTDAASDNAGSRETAAPCDGVHLLSSDDAESHRDHVEPGHDVPEDEQGQGSLQDDSSVHKGGRSARPARSAVTSATSEETIFSENRAAQQLGSPSL